MEGERQRKYRQAVAKSLAAVVATHQGLFAALKLVDPTVKLLHPFEPKEGPYAIAAHFVILDQTVSVEYKALRGGDDMHRVPTEKIRVTFGNHRMPRYANPRKKGHNFVLLAEKAMAEARTEISRGEYRRFHDQRMEIARGHAERLNQKFGLKIPKLPYADIDNSGRVVLRLPDIMTPGQIEQVLELLVQLGLAPGANQHG